MFKQCSKSQVKFDGRFLILVVVCLLLAAGSAAAQFKGYRSVPKATDVAPTTGGGGSPDVSFYQCHNGSNGDQQCTGSNWSKYDIDCCGNDARYLEGESIAYRNVYTGLTDNKVYNVVIAYKTTENGKHAIDYLTSYNHSETNANACSGVSPCAGLTTIAIPTDPSVSKGPNGSVGGGDDIVQIPGVLSVWNANNLSVSGYNVVGSYSGDSWTYITLTFTARETKVVLAWGGHIATRADWGVNNTASGLTGYPYSMLTSGFQCHDYDDDDDDDVVATGSSCWLERRMGRCGAYYPAFLTIIKQVNVAGGVSGQPFNFTATSNFGTPTSFTLFDNGVPGADRTTRVYFNTPVSNIQVVENPPPGWSVTAVNCTIASGGGYLGSATGSVANKKATVTLKEGNVASCTFINTFAGPTAAGATISGRVMTRSGVGIRGALVTVFDATTNTTNTAVTNTFGYYTFTEMPVEDYYILNVSAKRYTFSNPQQSFVMQGDLADINFTSDQ